ncbi:hypothetical protein ElyMa_003165300, partial [Elysia marginata]
MQPQPSAPGEVVFIIQVKVSLKDPGTVTLAPVFDQVRVEVLKWEWGIHFHIHMCLTGCSKVVGTRQNVGVSPIYNSKNVLQNTLI